MPQTHIDSDSVAFFQNHASVLTNGALAHRLRMVAADPTVFTGPQRSAYLREAAKRLDT